MAKFEWTKEVEETVIEMRNDGCSWREIAEHFDISKETLRKNVNNNLTVFQHTPEYRNALGVTIEAGIFFGMSRFNLSRYEILNNFSSVIQRKLAECEEG